MEQKPESPKHNEVSGVEEVETRVGWSYSVSEKRRKEMHQAMRQPNIC
jgi:hypothetical protein